MEKILITGATGLLGSRLVPYLKKCDYKVITHSLSKQADFMFDLSDKKKSFEMLTKIQPNVIINLVSQTNIELCEKQVYLAYLVNTRSVESLTNWIASSKIDCHLIQVSTDHLYDGVALHSEDDITITNNYAFSKYAGELAAAKVPSSILRTNFVGRSQVSYRESLTDWIYKATKSHQSIELLSDVFFSPLSITLLVNMIEIVLQKKPTGTYNLGSHGGMSKADFAFTFAEHLNLPTDTMKQIEVNQASYLKAYRPKNMCMDSSKFEKILGIKLPNLKDLIEQIAEEYNEIS